MYFDWWGLQGVFAINSNTAVSQADLLTFPMMGKGEWQACSPHVSGLHPWLDIIAHAIHQHNRAGQWLSQASPIPDSTLNPPK